MNSVTIDQAIVRQALRGVMDPELGCNIVDLGLVYGIAVEHGKITVTMTLTTPGCPMDENMARGVQSALCNLKGVEEVDVQVVWDPPWTPARMTPHARAETGIYAD